LFKIDTADLAKPRNRSVVTRPYILWEGGVWAWGSGSWLHQCRREI